mmetsp:Transcript_4291/g.10466  ORF Transcript_4291/g.10466 Transcript_4291/m.10466 type:complete len:490 (-) Transcript_4291:687-2156(-)
MTQPGAGEAELDFTDFADYYNALECDPDADVETIKKSYRKLVLDWHPDKRPDSPAQTGKKMFQLINDAWNVLQDDTKRQEYTVLWKEYQKQKLMPFERAELARKEGNEYYKKGQTAAKENNIPQALTMYQGAIEKYSAGIRESQNDHRLYSNRALCYAVLRDWARAKKDAHRVVEIRAGFMKGWFTLVRSYMMENNVAEAERQLLIGMKNCDNHPDLVKLQKEINERKSEQESTRTPRRESEAADATYTGAAGASTTGAGVTSNANTSTSKATSPANVLNASSSGRPISYRDVTPSRTPPTPLMQSRLAASRGLAPQWAAQNLDATGNFGQEGPFDNTANFGRSIGYARTPPQGNSPRFPPGMASPPQMGGGTGLNPPRYATPPRMGASGGLAGASGGLGSSIGSGRGYQGQGPIDYGTANPLNQSGAMLSQTIGGAMQYAYPRSASRTPPKPREVIVVEQPQPVRAPSLREQANRRKDRSASPRLPKG